MKTENLELTTKDLGYYESLPYTITIRRDEDGDFVATIQELPGCMAHGTDEAAAIEEIRSMKRLWIETALESGEAIPEPQDEAMLPSGKWVQRVPRKLHRDLVRLAQQENVSLNQLVTSMLSEHVTLKSCVHAVRACVNDAFTVHTGSTERNIASWVSQDQPWHCAVHMVPSGGVTKALSRVEKLTWGGQPHMSGYKWRPENVYGDLTKDYLQEHAIIAEH